jgi:hypothetical protein
MNNTLLALALFASLAPYAAKAQSYCSTATQIMLADNKEEDLNKVYLHCHPGDIIGIPPDGHDGGKTVARLCDFSKAMPLAGGLLYCVLGPKRSLY